MFLLARLDQHRPLARSTVDIRKVAKDVAAAARTVEPRRLIKFSCAADELFVVGEGDRLWQAFSNLLSNVRLHTPSDTPAYVTLSAEIGRIEIVVRGRGSGLTSDVADGVVDRFYQASNNGGSGLGLAIVQSIVEAHGGSVAVVTNLGEGFAATVRLPATVSAAKPRLEAD